MPSFDGGGFFGGVKDFFLSPFRLIALCVFIIIILVALGIYLPKPKKFDVEKPIHDRHRMLDYTCPLSNPDIPVPPSSDKQSQDMVSLALHRSGKQIAQLNQTNLLSSANKAAKLNFGLNTYDEITTYE
jgi:hypothetical protein